MADLKNITINELPFKENLEDTNILHVSDGQDKQTTLARVWEWAKLKAGFTTNPKLKNILLSTSDKKLERIPLDSFFNGAIGGILNALSPLNREALLEEGFSEIEIFTYEIARKSPFTRLGEYFYMDIRDNRVLEDFLSSEQAQEVLFSFGISLANGEKGSRDARGVFLRAVDAGSERESEEREIGQLQMDAMQKIWGQTSFRIIDNSVSGQVSNGAFKQNNIITRKPGVYGSQDAGWATDKFDTSLVARTATETRPKNINALLFQKVKDVDWNLIPSLPIQF